MNCAEVEILVKPFRSQRTLPTGDAASRSIPPVSPAVARRVDGCHCSLGAKDGQSTPTHAAAPADTRSLQACLHKRTCIHPYTLSSLPIYCNLGPTDPNPVPTALLCSRVCPP